MITLLITLLLGWLSYNYLVPSILFKRAPTLHPQNVKIHSENGKFWGDSQHKGTQSVLITGASQGIGKELAFLYSYLGYKNIVIASRNTAQLEQVARECIRVNPSVTVHVMEYDAMSDTSLIQRTLKATNGELDCLVLNHIKPCYIPIVEASDPTLLARDCVQVNYIAYVQLTIDALPHLANTAKQRNEKSQIIAVSSLAGKVPLPNVHAYGASKAALNQWFGDLRAELLASPLYKDYISVTTCLLSAINTEGFRQTAAKDNPTVLSIAAKPQDAAYYIINSSISNSKPGAVYLPTQGDVYFPPYIAIMPLLAAISPTLAGWVVHLAHKTGNEEKVSQRHERLEGVAKWAHPLNQ
jgi:short-subunit dehydrogenase